MRARLLRAAARLLALVALVIIVGAPMGLFSGTRPDNLGVHDGRLAPPKPTPNNVNSQVDANADPQHYIAPLRYSGDAARAWARLGEIVARMPRATLIESEPNYLYVEFRSRIMRFVDDAEFYLDPKTGVIQVRSAARLGRSDFGVNRERIESIRAQFVRHRGALQ